VCRRERRFQQRRSALRPVSKARPDSSISRTSPFPAWGKDGRVCEDAQLVVRSGEILARVRKVPIVTLNGNYKTPIQEGMKRTIQINVKLSPEDFQMLKKAAEKKWPGAVVTNSGIVLGLAKIAAREALKKGRQ